jgi:hypothetical protein
MQLRMLANLRANNSCSADSFTRRSLTVAVLRMCEHTTHLDRACWPAINSAEPDLTVFYCVIVRLRSCDRGSVAHLRDVQDTAHERVRLKRDV